MTTPLTTYLNEYKPMRSPIEGAECYPFSARSSIQQIFRKAVADSGIKQPAYVHS